MAHEYPIYQKDLSGHDEDDRYFLSPEEKIARWRNPSPDTSLSTLKRERES